MISGFGSRVYGLWLKSWGLGCRVSQGSRFKVQSLGSSTEPQVMHRRSHPERPMFVSFSGHENYNTNASYK